MRDLSLEKMLEEEFEDKVNTLDLYSNGDVTAPDGEKVSTLGLKSIISVFLIPLTIPISLLYLSAS